MLKTILFVSWAQAATVAIFPSSAVDPNTALPIAVPVTYTASSCNRTPKFIEDGLPIVDPDESYYDDPANPKTHDCRVFVGAQIARLPIGAGYKAATKVGTATYGAFSTAFAKTAAMQAHACDTTPNSPATVPINQPVMLGWCADSREAITTWRIYRNGVLVTSQVTAGALSNAAGLRLYTITRVEAVAGSISIEVSGVNSAGEGARYTLPIFVVQSVPSAPSRGRISQP